MILGQDGRGKTISPLFIMTFGHRRLEYLAGTTKLSKNKLDALVLHVWIRLVGQVVRNVQAMSSVTNGIALWMVSEMLLESW